MTFTRKATILKTGIIISSFAFFLLPSKKESPSIIKNEKKEYSEEAAGASKWLFDARKNPITNEVNPQDVLNAINEINQHAYFKSSSSSPLNLNWEFMGPDNVGGRTRAVLIDKNNTQKLFAGGVSGGLWVSNNSALSWTQHSQSFENINITCITQAANGDIYFGTGENTLAFNDGTNSNSGFLGGGIWKSTDGGTSFTRLASTVPSSLSASVDWSSVARLGADPSNANRIYAATNRGLKVSDDGGTTWVNAITGGAATGVCVDVKVASDGTVIACVNNRAQISSNGNAGSFNLIPNTGTGMPRQNGSVSSGASRIEFSFAPSDPNYIYACVADGSSNLQGIYQTTDKGQTWNLIGPGGSNSFQPLSNVGIGGQGTYNNTIVVHPTIKERIFLGGVSLWKWEQSPNQIGIGQWAQIASGFASEQSGFYVHADIHTIQFNPSNPNVFYIGSDGGIGKTVNGGTSFFTSNKGYNVTQCYSVAFGSDQSTVMAGNQDNGTQLIDGTGNTPYSAKEINGGDGNDCEISFLNPNAIFSSIYFGSIRRSSNKGGTSASFYSERITSLSGFEGQSFASFVTPMALYENNYATNSPDSILFIASDETKLVAIGNGSTKSFSGTIQPKQASASIVPDSVVISAGSQIIMDDGAGNLSGAGTGSINYITGAYSFTFTNAPSTGFPIQLTFSVKYNAGSVVNIKSTTSDYPFQHTLINNLEPGDSILIQDVVQAKLAVGFSGNNGVWITKKPLDFSKTPEWYKVATVTSNVEALTWSADGDVLYVGTSSGNLYRISNMSAIKDSATGDIASNEVQVKTEIARFSRFITDIAVDPNDANRILVTLGNYGSSAYVYYCGNALSVPASNNTSNFISKQGTSTTKLPTMPVYSAIFVKDNPNTVIIGTEFGVYATSDITQAASSIEWTAENNGQGMEKVPVFKIRQQRWPWWNVSNSGTIYIGTHGKGIWKTDQYKVTTGINNPQATSSKAIKPIVNIYPNPASDRISMVLNIVKSQNVILTVYNLEGKILKSLRSDMLNEGSQTVDMSLDGLPSGTYILNVKGENMNESSRFIVL